MRRFLTGPSAALAVLALSFLISLAVFLLSRPDMTGRVFFYPDNAGMRIGAERRAVPVRRSPDEEIGIFLDELVLGPVSLELSPVLPRGTGIRHTAIIGNTACVDIDGSSVLRFGELALSVDAALENLRRNILFNFPRIDTVVFTIGGRQVGAPHYSGPDDGEEEKR